ncbi:unnamed protein product [[Candida] boidinii]|nr:unnamed protein product [[Candida] boidinii]
MPPNAQIGPNNGAGTNGPNNLQQQHPIPPNQIGGMNHMMATPGGMIPPNQLQQLDQNKNSPIGIPGNINVNIQKSTNTATAANAAPKRRRKTKEPKQAPVKQQPVKQQTPSNMPPQHQLQQQQQQQLPPQNIPMPVQMSVVAQQQLPPEPQLPPAPPREPTAEELRKLIPPPEVIKDLNYWSNSIRNNTKRSQKKSIKNLIQTQNLILN